MHIMVDATFPDSDAAMELCRMLDNEFADAIPVRLWAWALKTERESGKFRANPRQLSALVRWSGDPDLLVNALVSCGILERDGDDFRIRGWKRNARYFKERNRLQQIYNKRKRSRDSRVTLAGTTSDSREVHAEVTGVSSSSSYSYSNTGIGIPRELPKNHPEVAFFEAAFTQKFGGPKFSGNERGDAATIVQRCAESGVKWQDAIETFAGPDFRGHKGSLNKLKWNIRDVITAIKPAKPKYDHEAWCREQRERNEREIAAIDAESTSVTK